MTRIIIKKLIWDEWNRQHIKKHKVTEEEVSEVGKQLIYHKKSYKNRFLAIGRSGLRLLTIVVKRISKTTYYVITARDSSNKERRTVYEKEKQNS